MPDDPGLVWAEGKPGGVVARSFQFALAIRPGILRTLGTQLLRAGTSIGANLEEAQAGQSKADFVSKYAIAIKEARETRYWLRLIQSTDGTPYQTCAELISESEQLARIIGAIIVKAKSSPSR